MSTYEMTQWAGIAVGAVLLCLSYAGTPTTMQELESVLAAAQARLA
jgi:hypothetical protein